MIRRETRRSPAKRIGFEFGPSQEAINAVNNQAAAARSFALANGGSTPPGYFVIGDGSVIGSKQ